MNAQTRLKLIEQLKLHEGFRSMPYRDTKGFWTVGWGHNMDADSSLTGAQRQSLFKNGVTKEEATRFLQSDVDSAIRDLIRHLPWANQEPNEVRQAVLVELCFNMGIGHPGERAANGRDWKVAPKGLRSFRNTLARIQQGAYGQAAVGLLWNDEARKIPSKWHADVRDVRAFRLAEELRTGEWPRPNMGR